MNFMQRFSQTLNTTILIALLSSVQTEITHVQDANLLTATMPQYLQQMTDFVPEELADDSLRTNPAKRFVDQNLTEKKSVTAINKTIA
ncbi:hypothetical protein [Leptolyngbya ohadii]|uniref:hypothetical protein n=1 Tax=Leptolyngbya ohadii TaxID=1962290 RepID=UPI000B59A026|nr:hypothetical protein [Leptolyngbya ohadii]